MKDEGSLRDRPIGTLSIPLRDFELVTVYDRWYDMVPISGVPEGGKLRLVLQLAPATTNPFVGPSAPEPPAPTSEVVEIQVRLIEADSLPTVDALGSADPYCVLRLFDRPQIPSVKSRMIDNTLHPRWNQSLRLPIFSLAQDILRIELFDHNKLKDVIMAYLDLPIAELPLGVTTTATRSMIPLSGSTSDNPPRIHLKYQVTHPRQIPFVDDPFVPLSVHLQIQFVENAAGKDIFVGARLDSDIRLKYSSTRNTGVWNEFIHFSVLDYRQSSIILEIHSKKVLLADGTVPLAGFVPEKTQILTVVLKGFTAHIAVQVANQ
jgi:hypothetical protein